MRREDGALIRHLKRQLVLARRKEAAGAPAVSPLAPKSMPELPVIAGAEFASIAAGVRYRGRDDVMLARLAPGTTVAGVFTRSATRAAPVLDCQDKLSQAIDQSAGAAIIVNAGNANAFTGDNGRHSVEQVCTAVAEQLEVPVARVFSASTGVIGELLPHDRIMAKLGELTAGLSPGRLADAAAAIRTTDTFTKVAATTAAINGCPIKIAGIAKGSGMIAPDMATMLVYIFTDAAISQSALQSVLSSLTQTTFNAITVDSDTSTSDTLMIAATGQANHPTIEAADDPALADFRQGLSGLMLDLAHQVVRDGEGATKFVEVKVSGAVDEADAKRAALAVANSPLVKTAIAGEDPNWGRVVMAIGKSGAQADRDRLSIRFGPHVVAEKGWVSPVYRESEAARYMTQENLVISVDLGLGDAEFTAWTCDLTHQYIAINADYRS